MAISENPDVPAFTAQDKMVRETFELAPLPETVCFTCGEPVTHPAIYWQGESRIWLHPRCAFGLSMGLLQDVERLDGLLSLRWALQDRIGS